MLSRRQLLLGSVALAGTAGGLGYWYEQRVPEAPYSVPDVPTGPVLRGELASRYLPRKAGWTIAYPPGSRPGDGLPLLLVLHGRGDDHDDMIVTHKLERFLAAAVAAGVPPFALVSADGGESYWHPRKDGTDASRMLTEELLPLVASKGLRTQRFAVGGWSMGGYGALLLAERLGPSRIAAVVADSPAIFASAGDRSKGSFDSDADFRAHDVVVASAALAGIPVRITCGTSDPFLPGARRLLAALPAAERELSKGGHDLAFWRHVAPAQLAFAGRHL